MGYYEDENGNTFEIIDTVVEVLDYGEDWIH